MTLLAAGNYATRLRQEGDIFAGVAGIRDLCSVFLN